MANLVIERLIATQIACAYVMYVNEKNSSSEEILSFDEYCSIYKENLEINNEEITLFADSIIKKRKEEKKQKKRGKK